MIKPRRCSKQCNWAWGHWVKELQESSEHIEYQGPGGPCLQACASFGYCSSSPFGRWKTAVIQPSRRFWMPFAQQYHCYQHLGVVCMVEREEKGHFLALGGALNWWPGGWNWGGVICGLGDSWDEGCVFQYKFLSAREAVPAHHQDHPAWNHNRMTLGRPKQNLNQPQLGRDI